MRSVRVLVVLLSLLPALALGAQEISSAPGRAIRATELNGETISLDGVLDEPMWSQATVASDFLQRDPDNGAPATERTEVRVLYDASRLLLGVTLHDSEPGRLLGNQMQRDQPFGADDRFMWTIDTFLDGRSGYFFEINPSGAMGDGLIDPSSNNGDLGAGVNKSWDGIWTAHVRRSPDGWTAEIELPFKSLNFDPQQDAWGINFQRTVRRKNEESLWSGYARNLGLTRMAAAGRVEGLRGLSQGIGLDLKPFVVGTLSSAPGRGQSSIGSTGDVGLDVLYSVTPALRANLSLNTDFAETEVDQRQVNLTRFPLFFQEKRDFFLQGASFFDFAREIGNQVRPFFSRRIGLDRNGLPQPIDVGAKLTGQAGAFDVGALQVRTREEGSEPGEDFSVVRIRRRLFAQSYVGGLATRRSTRTAALDDRHTAAADMALRTSTLGGDKTADLSAYYVATTNPLGTGDSAAWGFRAQYPNDPWVADLAVRAIEPNYSPAVGFLQRRGFRRMNPQLAYTFRPASNPWIRSVQVEGDLEFINDSADRPLGRQLQYRPATVVFQDGSRFQLEIADRYDRLEQPFEISDGVVLPAGNTYRYLRYHIEGNTPQRHVVSLSSELEVGDFFSGRRRQLILALGVRPRRGVAVSIETERNNLDLQEGTFSTSVLRLVANTQFGPWASLVNNLQYDDVSKALAWQVRFRWIQRPGNDLFLVYTHNWQRGLNLSDPNQLSTLDNRLATKLVYTLRF